MEIDLIFKIAGIGIIVAVDYILFAVFSFDIPQPPLVRCVGFFPVLKLQPAALILGLEANALLDVFILEAQQPGDSDLLATMDKGYFSVMLWEWRKLCPLAGIVTEVIFHELQQRVIFYFPDLVGLVFSVSGLTVEHPIGKGHADKEIRILLGRQLNFQAM